MRQTIIISLTGVLFAAAVLLADSGSSNGKSSSREGKPTSSEKKVAKQPPNLTPAREAAAIAFVRKNHPELEELLVYLKDNREGDYRRAVFELYRTSERLAQFQDRGDSERYELELKLWQAHSRMQLIVARLKMNDNEELRADLRAALNEQMDLRATIFRRDRDKATDRLNRLDEQIRRLTENRDSEIERQVLLLTRTSKAKKGTSPLQGNEPAKPTDNK
jgi:hypothetical protein